MVGCVLCQPVGPGEEFYQDDAGQEAADVRPVGDPAAHACPERPDPLEELEQALRPELARLEEQQKRDGR